MPRVRRELPAEQREDRSAAWRADGIRGRRRTALVMAGADEAARYDHLSRRAIAAAFADLDDRLRDYRLPAAGPLSAAERAELRRLEAIADELRRAS